MKKLLFGAARVLVLPLGLFLGACVNETDNGTPKTGGSQKAYGRFLISLKVPTDFSVGYTTIEGKFTPKPSPSPVAFIHGPLVGGCRVITPSAPSCIPGCSSGFICVANNQCQEDPEAIKIGTVTAKGIKTKKTSASFDLKWGSRSYQVSPNDTLVYPPFSENDPILFTGTGDSIYTSFTLSTKGISPLSVLNDTITMADGKPMSLKWVPQANTGSATISVSVDISHHGGLKGKIECLDVADNGSLDIPATLVDQLKALGISGFPKVELTRIAVAKSTETHAELAIESNITKLLNIPGLISCDDDEGCPLGQKCQADLQCKMDTTTVTGMKQ